MIATVLIQELTPTELTDRQELLREQIHWHGESADSIFCGIEEIPWFGVTDGESLTSIIGFSADNRHNRPLYTPYGPRDAAERAGSMIMSFNSDHLSRGVGELLVNDPAYMQPTRAAGSIAVRSVSVATRPKADIAAADMNKSDRALILRHGVLTLGSAALNALAGVVGLEARGSAVAARLMELRYKRAPLVRMPIPPIWRRQQKQQGVPAIDEPGEIMLVRGRGYTVPNTMHYAGFYRQA